MQIKYFTIPAFDSGVTSEEMNKFLRSHRVLEMQQEFVSVENGAYWCISIKYMQSETTGIYPNKKEKVDYRKLLSEETFVIFEKLREHRKQIAKDDAVPAYAVFTDEELAEIAKLNEISEQKIKTIKGIGEKKTEKYGKLIAEMFSQLSESLKLSDS